MQYYQTKPSCRYLTHPHASFHGCTLNEMGIIIVTYIAVEVPMAFVLAALLQNELGGYLGALLLVLLVMAILTFFVLIKQTAKLLGYIRQGKPNGYLKHRVAYLLYQYCGKRMPYVVWKGSWITRRHINVRSHQQ